MSFLLLLVSCDGAAGDTAAARDSDVQVFLDADRDGYGAGAPFSAPLVPGYSSTDGDCDDSDATVRPGASEICDGRDDDCDGLIDEGVSQFLYADEDQDGYGGGSAVETCAGDTWAETGGDCDDASASTYPGAPEVCGDRIANDCGDGEDARCQLSGEVPLASSGLALYADSDGDGLGRDLTCIPPDLDSGRAAGLLASETRPFGPADSAGGAWVLSGLGAIPDGSHIIDAVAHGIWTDSPDSLGAEAAGAIVGDMNFDGNPDLALANRLVSLPAADVELEASAFAVLFHQHDSLGIGAYASMGEKSLLVSGSGNVYDETAGWGANVGQAFLLEGPIEGEVDVAGQALATIGPPVAHEEGYFGWTSCTVDLDGDGVRDAVIGAPALGAVSYPEFLDGGAAYVIFGPFSGSVSVAERDGALAGAEARIGGDSTHRGIGSTMSCTGDIDADGYPEIVVGAPEAGSGSALLYSGPFVGDLGSGDAVAVISGSAPDDFFGRRVESGSDMDADGHNELVASAIHDDGHGSVHVFYGPVSGSHGAEDADAVAVAGAAGAYGAIVATCGDIDEDGFDDLAVGAPGDATYGTFAGGVFVLFGGELN